MGVGAKDYFLVDGLSPEGVLDEFFRVHSAEGVRDCLWYVFKAWVFSPAEGRSLYSDEEIALFLDQLIDLVAAVSALHQANRVSGGLVEGDGHD